VFAILPGKYPNQFYICTGRVPIDFWSQKPKFNWMLPHVITISLAAQAFIGIKYYVYKFKGWLKHSAGK